MQVSLTSVGIPFPAADDCMKQLGCFAYVGTMGQCGGNMNDIMIACVCTNVYTLAFNVAGSIANAAYTLCPHWTLLEEVPIHPWDTAGRVKRTPSRCRCALPHPPTSALGFRL